MRERNKDARCGNCGYLDAYRDGSGWGGCLRLPGEKPIVHSNHVCGEHPEYFIKPHQPTQQPPGDDIGAES